MWGNSFNFSFHEYMYLHALFSIQSYTKSLANMYIAMCPFFHINNIFTDWKVDGHQQLSWVTQTCATKVEGRVGCLLYHQ